MVLFFFGEVWVVEEFYVELCVGVDIVCVGYCGVGVECFC